MECEIFGFVSNLPMFRVSLLLRYAIQQALYALLVNVFSVMF